MLGDRPCLFGRIRPCHGMVLYVGVEIAMMLEDARALLGLGDVYTLADAKARWRACCHQYHPDHGGTAALFAQVQEAYRVVCIAGPQQPHCTICRGRKFTVVTHMWTSVKMPCQCVSEGGHP